MLSGIVNFVNTEVQEIMKPRVDITVLNITDDYETVKKTIIESGFSRIPVYEEDIDEVFRAAIESVDEAIISSMLHASAVTGRAGNHYKSLADLYKPGEKSEK